MRSSRQAPTQESTLRTGDTVGGRFVVERYLGSSGGGISYLCNDRETQQPTVIKVLEMPFPGEERFSAMSEQVRVATKIAHRNLAQAVGMGRTGKGEIFIAMEYVDGSTLSQLITQRRGEGRTLSIRDTFTVLAHVANALTMVHKQTAHGVLTPYNIYVSRQGVVRVGNLAFGRMVSEFMHERGDGPFVDSIYVAPEVAADPTTLSSRSDIYSLGMIAAELLNPLGLPNERKAAHDAAVDGLSQYPPSLFTLISQSLATNPDQRPVSVEEFRQTFEEIAREVGAQLTGPPPPGALPIEPAVAEREGEGSGSAEDDLFDFEIEGGPAAPTSEDRYLVQKGGLDYGPFTEEQLLEQLHADEIDEHSIVLDRVTQDRAELQEIDLFREAVLAHIPVRTERLRREAEARAALQRKVKQGGKAVLVMGIVAGLFVLAGMLWFWLHQPNPEPMALENAFASLDYRFLPPPQEFQAVAVDAAVLQGIFDPRASEAEVARQLRQMRAKSPRAGKKKSTSSRGQGGAGGDDDSGVAEVNMGAGGSMHHLTDNEIREIIIAQFGQLRSCLMLEFNQNRRFKGVSVQFFIRPSGTTGGVQLKESQYASKPVGECLVQRFRALKFPEHGAISNRGVTFPLYFE